MPPPMLYTFFPGTPVTREVGKLVIAHGHLEYQLKLLIKSLHKISIQDALLEKETGKKMASALRIRIKELANAKLAANKSVLDELLAQITLAGDLADFRNLVAHGFWCRRTTGGAAQIRDVQNHKWYPVPTVKKLQQSVRETSELADELNRSRLSGNIKRALS